MTIGVSSVGNLVYSQVHTYGDPLAGWWRFRRPKAVIGGAVPVVGRGTSHA